MCGICGCFRFDDKPVDPEALGRATHALFHRGPDHQSALTPSALPSLGLGATRLAILDPSPVGHQPFRADEDRYLLVFNGEVYNFRELRRELESSGIVFRTDTDTEVVLRACAKWGTNALAKFNGMWGLCFFDCAERKGFLARDRFGIKPLLYHKSDTALAFSSELRSLAHLVDREPERCPDAIVELLLFGYIAPPRTIREDCRRLPPGHFLEFGAGGAKDPQSFYDLAGAVRARAESLPPEPDFRPLIRDALTRSVMRRRVSDVPIGAFLSGGLDSSIITLHLSEVIGAPINTFSVGYADHKTFDESPYARMVARDRGTNHHELMLARADVVRALPEVLAHLGEPFGDSSIVPTALVSKLAREHVTVALSGDGGDELFAGYWRYMAHGTLAAYERIPRVLRSGVIEPLMGKLGASKGSRLGNRARQFQKLLRARGLSPMHRHLMWSRILPPGRESLIEDPSLVTAALERASQRAADFAKAAIEDDPLARILACDVQNQLPGDMLHKVDLASMMHSLEVRVPFLDHELVELALAIPAKQKLVAGKGKHILTETYRGHLPPDILDRSKQGFEVPIGELLRTDLRDYYESAVTPSALQSAGPLSPTAARALFQDHLATQSDNSDVLFALLSLCPR